MVLVGLIAEFALVVGSMLLVATIAIVGPHQFVQSLKHPRGRVAAVTVPVGVVAVILAFRWLSRELLPWVSWRVVGIEITGHLWALEGTTVAVIQSLGGEVTTSLAVFVYIYGYAFLITFPLVAYYALEQPRALQQLLFAYGINYLVGLVFYVSTIAYGPRNTDHLVFQDLLYESMPHAAYLTNSVNENVNVFPSLHASLSMTVLLMALLTRSEYPLWVPVAVGLAPAVMFSTMYLGIHWLTDVVAGAILALFSVWVATYIVTNGPAVVRDGPAWVRGPN